MMHDRLSKNWWTATELAEAGFPDLPTTRRGVEALAKRLGWREDPQHARARVGRGGGWEYHWRLLPARAQREVISRMAMPAPEAEPAQDRGDAWAWFDGLPERVKAKAERRLRVLQEVEALSHAMTKSLAVNMISKTSHVSERSIWGWFGSVHGVDPADWLPYLAPRNLAAPPKSMTAQADQKFYDWLKADFLRLEGPSFAKCWRTAKTLCEAHGLSYLSERTARRWMDDAIPRVSQVYMREGEKGLLRCYPAQVRDRSTLAALEGVNADCHKIDVFVYWPGFDKPIRPQIVAFQDLYSGKILSWRVDVDPNKVAVMSAFMELLRDWGIPKHCLFDNGREFANKWLTGGAPTRFRFKVREDEPLGVLALLGVKIHWATPGHGQAKPIERAFGGFANDIAKDPRFAGAYVGHKPDAKPENYMSRAIELADFLQVVAEGVVEHNARLGRLSPTAKGRSFDQTFAASYEQVPIRKATEEQLRLCLMAQEVRKLHKNNGQMTLHKNFYWSEWMSEIAGQEVVARFNPENLHEGAHIYSLAGEFLGYADCSKKVGFFDIASARAAAREKSRRLRQQRKIAKDLRPMSVGGLAADLDNLPKVEEVRPEAKVVKLAQLDELARLEQRGKGGLISRPMPVPDLELEASLKVLTPDFRKPKAPEKPTESAADRFRRALDIERRSKAGEAVSEAEAAFWERMQRLPEYRAQRVLYDRWGEQAIGE